jgi:hypothetical protein
MASMSLIIQYLLVDELGVEKLKLSELSIRSFLVAVGNRFGNPYSADVAENFLSVVKTESNFFFI